MRKREKPGLIYVRKKFRLRVVDIERCQIELRRSLGMDGHARHAIADE
jgi:hypothetical protein